ncbi:MAG: PAS domain-containing protein [Desulfovibrio sp.]
MSESFDNSSERLPDTISEVFDSFTDLIIFTDKSGLVKVANAQAERHFGEGLIGKPIWNLFEVQTTEIKDFITTFPAGKVHEVPYGTEGASYSLRVIPLPSTLSSGGTVVIATNNAPIVELHETYEERIDDNIAALDDSISLFNALFEAAQDPTLLIDSSYRILASNPMASSLFGKAASLAGENCLDYFVPESRPKLSQSLKEWSGTQPETLNKTLYALHADGKHVAVVITIHKVKLQSDNAFHIVLRDMSDIQKLEIGLEKSQEEVAGMNVALRSVIESVEEEKKDMYEDFALQVREQILPALERMSREPLPQMRKSFHDFISERLTVLTGTTGDPLEDLMLKLTPREVEVCRHIEAAESSERIAELLGISVETILTHRKNIRKKLGLRGHSISLFGYLRSQKS